MMMRYVILLALMLCLPVRGEAWQVVGGGVGAANECLGYAVCQNFEGTGYDNSESWSEFLGAGVGTVDEDSTSYTPRGSQLLYATYTGYHANGSKISFSGATELWGHFMFKVVATQTGDLKFFKLLNAADNQELAWIMSTNQMKIKGAQLSGSTAYGSSTYLANTWYHFWWYYKAETSEGAANGIFNVWVGTNTSRPASPEFSNTNGPQVEAPGHLYLQSSDGVSDRDAAYAFDQVLVKTSEFTTVPE